VAGASGGAGEAVEDGRTGLVVRRPTDVGAATRAIGRLLGDQALRSEMGDASRRRAEASFDYDRLAPRLAASLADMEG
jgi:glycosyltransferase involved in cell wall biosynthesis